MFTKEDRIKIVTLSLMNEIPVDLEIDNKKYTFVMEDYVLYVLNKFNGCFGQQGQMVLTSLTINELIFAIDGMPTEYIDKLNRILMSGKINKKGFINNEYEYAS